MTPSSDKPRRSRLLEGVALLCIALSALLFQRSATATWAEARAADGRRVQFSPIGLADFGLGTTGTPPSECRWWPRLGNQELCSVAPDGADAMQRVRRVYPLVVIALWTAVLALFLTALRIPGVPRSIGLAVTMALPIMAIMALVDVFQGAPRALAVLAGASPLVPVATGFGTIAAAAATSAIAVVLLTVSRRLQRPESVAPYPV